MNRNQVLVLAGVVAVLSPLAAGAQEVRNREAHQQGRIGQGVTSGQITAGGAARLENRESAINTSRQADLAANGGHLTRGEDRNLNNRQNALSRSIYNDKHNDVAQPGVVPR